MDEWAVGLLSAALLPIRVRSYHSVPPALHYSFSKILWVIIIFTSVSAQIVPDLACGSPLKSGLHILENSLVIFSALVF
jgi:hypothetical protein